MGVRCLVLAGISWPCHPCAWYGGVHVCGRVVNKVFILYPMLCVGSVSYSYLVCHRGYVDTICP